MPDSTEPATGDPTPVGDLIEELLADIAAARAKRAEKRAAEAVQRAS